MLAYVAKRAAFAAGTFAAITFTIYALLRFLRPDLHPHQRFLPGVWHDVQRALFHLDFGRAQGWPGSPQIHDLWRTGFAPDLWLIGGAVVVGVTGGVLAGLWCVRRPRSLASRALESAAMTVYCAPAYFLGLSLLLLFNPTFGVLPVPYFFEAFAHNYDSPFADPWGWFRTLLLPWLLVGAPLGAAILRLMVALTLDELDQNYVRTAQAKGLRWPTVLRRHAARPAYGGVASLVWGWVPFVVTNVVLVEWVFSVPGFFANTKRAMGKGGGATVIDLPMLQALALWAGLLIVVLSALADIALVTLDPRVRSRT